VDLALPRFQLASSLDLARPLSAMGVSLAFTGDADFSGIDGERDLAVDGVLHKAHARPPHRDGFACPAAQARGRRMSAPCCSRW
jgi:serine protease inhibitor